MNPVVDELVKNGPMHKGSLAGHVGGLFFHEEAIVQIDDAVRQGIIQIDDMGSARLGNVPPEIVAKAASNLAARFGIPQAKAETMVRGKSAKRDSPASPVGDINSGSSSDSLACFTRRRPIPIKP